VQLYFLFRKDNKQCFTLEIIGTLPEKTCSFVKTEDEVEPDHEPDDNIISGKVSFDLKDAASQAEYETIINVLKHVKFNKAKAAGF